MCTRSYDPDTDTGIKLDALTPELQISVLASSLLGCSDLAAMRCVSRRCLAAASDPSLWQSPLRSATRPWRRCGAVPERRSATDVGSFFALVALPRGYCPECRDAELSPILAATPRATFEQREESRAALQAAWRLHPSQLAALRGSPLACTATAIFALWHTRHGARWWVRASRGPADLETAGSGPSRALVEEAVACVVGGALDAGAGWMPLPAAPPDESPIEGTGLVLGAQQWDGLEAWLADGTGAGERVARLLPARTGGLGARLEQSMRTALIAHERVLSGACVLLLYSSMAPMQGSGQVLLRSPAGDAEAVAAGVLHGVTAVRVPRSASRPVSPLPMQLSDCEGAR